MEDALFARQQLTLAEGQLTHDGDFTLFGEILQLTNPFMVDIGMQTHKALIVCVGYLVMHGPPYF